MSRGAIETEELQKNIESQLERIMSQLEDLETMKDEMEPDEYEEQKEETLEQLKDFQEYLTSSQKGNMSLIDSFGAMQLAIQAAISSAFKTPEVIRMFAKKQPGQLRQRLESLEEQFRVGKLGRALYLTQKAEVLSAIEKLGEKLLPGETEFLEQNASAALKKFTLATEASSSKMKSLMQAGR